MCLLSFLRPPSFLVRKTHTWSAQQAVVPDPCWRHRPRKRGRRRRCTYRRGTRCNRVMTHLRKNPGRSTHIFRCPCQKQCSRRGGHMCRMLTIPGCSSSPPRTPRSQCVLHSRASLLRTRCTSASLQCLSGCLLHNRCTRGRRMRTYTFQLRSLDKTTVRADQWLFLAGKEYNRKIPCRS